METEKSPIVGGDDSNSLENPETSITQSSDKPSDSKPQKISLPKKINKALRRINIYLLLFTLLLIIAGIITLIAIQAGRRDDSALNSQDLSADALDQLSENNTQVGDPKQTLTIASNSVFNGKVLVRDSLDVAGTIKVGGALSLPGITVSGTSNFENVQVSNNLGIAGSVSAQGNLSVTGSGSFGGPLSAPSINVDNLVLNNDLSLNRHIETSGGIPGISRGSATGGGGTVSLSGSDIAGTITINVGGGPPAGVLATVSFTRAYSRTPHIAVTPVGSAAAGLNFYITRNSTGFTLATTNAPSAASSFSFDYIVIN